MKIQGGILFILEFSLRIAVTYDLFTVPRENLFSSECPLYSFPSVSDLMGTSALSSNKNELCFSSNGNVL